jgi:hypothetical protein
LPAASDAEAAFIALDIEVFLTNDWLVDTGGATTNWFVRTGRDAGALEGLEEVNELVLSVAAVGGWFTGWLDIVFMSLGRS